MTKKLERVGEIKKEPLTVVVDSGETWKCFDEEHTIADIARWIRSHRWDEEIISLLNEMSEMSAIRERRSSGEELISPVKSYHLSGKTDDL